jgi:hypothetical protein
MPITLTKKKPAVQEVTLVVSPLHELIDEYGRQHEEAAPVLAAIKELQEQLKPFQEAKKALEEAVLHLDQSDSDRDPYEVYTEKGAEYQVELGKQEAARSITDLKAVRDLMGDDVFMKVAKVNLKDVDNYLTLPEREAVLETKFGKREIKVHKRMD